MSKLSNDIKLLLEAAAKPEMVKAAEASVEVEQYEPTDTGGSLRKLASYMRKQDTAPSYDDLRSLLGDLNEG